MQGLLDVVDVVVEVAVNDVSYILKKSSMISIFNETTVLLVVVGNSKLFIISSRPLTEKIVYYC